MYPSLYSSDTVVVENNPNVNKFESNPKFESNVHKIDMPRICINDRKKGFFKRNSHKVFTIGCMFVLAVGIYLLYTVLNDSSYNFWLESQRVTNATISQVNDNHEPIGAVYTNVRYVTWISQYTGKVLSYEYGVLIDVPRQGLSLGPKRNTLYEAGEYIVYEPAFLHYNYYKLIIH